MSKYLDLNGLLYFKGKLDNLFETKAVVAGKIDNPSTKTAGQILSYNGTSWVASDAPESGVISFNGRSGAVLPTAGDYDASQIDFDDTAADLDAADVQEAIEALKDIADGNAEGIASITGLNGIVKATNGSAPVVAVAGVDYQLPLTAGTDYQVPVSFADGYDASTNKAATVKTVTDAIGSITTFSFHICTASEYDPTTRIPTIVSPSTSTIYLVPKSTAGTNNSYVEWAYISSNWEKIGETEISIESITNAEIDTLFA